MVIFRIIRNLIRLALRIALFPVFFLMRNVFGIIILCGIGYVIYTSYQTDQVVSQTTSAPAVQRENSRELVSSGQVDAQGQPIMINRITVMEDGNSAFSTDLLSKMSSAELNQYSQVLFWVMSNQPNGEAHKWNHLNIKGTITPTKTFLNKRGHACRYFDEVLKVHEVQQTLNGMACQRKGGGWCKLRPDSTPGCNLSRPAPGMLESIGESINNLF